MRQGRPPSHLGESEPDYWRVGELEPDYWRVG
jgi:hypothetical protein